MKKIIAGLAMTVLVSSMIFAEEEAKTEETKTVKLTIDQAVEYALKNNRTLKSNDIDLEIKERASKYSWNVFLPTVQLAGTMNSGNNSNYSSVVSGIGQGASWASGTVIPQSSWDSMAKSAGYEDNENAHWTAVGSLSVSLNLSLAYIGQIKAAKASYEAGKISWEQSQNETLVNIKKLFYGLLLQQESLKIQKQTLENARQRMIQAQTSYSNGAIPELKLLQTQVSYQNTKPDVESAEMSLNQQLDTFAFMLGLPVGDSKIELDGSIEPVYVETDVDELLAKYADSTLTVKSLEANIEVLKENLRAVNLSTWTPALALSWSKSPAIIYGWDFSRWGNSDNWTDSGSLSITLAMNITNMLPWSANRQQAKDLQANIEKLQLNLEMVQENQKVSVRKAVDTLKLAKEQIDAMGRNVRVAQQAYDMTYRSYRNGMTELLDLRDAESSLNQAKLGQLNQKFNYISALMDLENTLNVKLTPEEK